MTTLRNKLAAISLSLSVICALTFASTAQTKSSSKSERTSVNQENNTWNWRHNDSAVDLRVTIRGKVEFTDDYTDIKSISDGGDIRVKDDRSGAVRKFEASAEGGSIKRSYSINGQPSAFDDDARKWLANILNQTVRLGGYDAKARVQKLLKQSGPLGVLAEIPQLTSDYVKRIYFNELFAQGQLDADSARQALRLAGTELSSDYEKAELLVKMSDSYLVNDEMRNIYIEGVNTIQSDYEKGRVLSALLKKEPGKETLLFTLKSASTISSDYEKAQLLLRVAHSGSNDEAVRTALIEAARTIGSEYERGRVLSAVFK